MQLVEKNEVIEGEKGIHDPAFLEGVSEMCNSSENVKEEGRVEGEKQKEIEIILNMVNEGASDEIDEMIIKFTKISSDKLNKIKQKY